MKNFLIGAVLAVLAMAGASAAQKDKDETPTSWLNFVVLKEDNGKPVRNAAVIMHPVSDRGRQQKGGMELKSDLEGKCNFDGIPYGMLRVQVLAQGFQTYGEDFDVNKPKMAFTIKLKRPQGQFSVYDDHANSAAPKDAPPPNQPPQNQPPQNQKDDQNKKPD
jgi:opacity protein-like surface antigen